MNDAAKTWPWTGKYDVIGHAIQKQSGSIPSDEQALTLEVIILKGGSFLFSQHLHHPRDTL